MKYLLILIIAGLLSLACTKAHNPESIVPEGWNRIEADNFFTFYLPKSMQLISEERCEECAWGSAYSDSEVRLYAEYSSWNEEYAAQYLAKQAEYMKEMAAIDGKRAKIQAWQLEQPVVGYYFTAEVRIYDSETGKMRARISALCKERNDLETAKEIFKTIKFR